LADWIFEKQRTQYISLLQHLPEISPGPRLPTAHGRWRRFRGCTPGMRGSPERQAAGKWRNSYSFRSSLRCMDSALSQLPPQEIILPFDRSASYDDDCIYPGENRSSRGWRFLRSIITRQSTLYNRGCGLILLLDNNRSFPRQSDSSSKEHLQGRSRATNNPISEFNSS
jgi:hypothetical protein